MRRKMTKKTSCTIWQGSFTRFMQGRTRHRLAKRKLSSLSNSFRPRMTIMQLVEQHLIRKTDPLYTAIDQAAFASKNLYNQANYLIRQAYLHEGKYLPYAE